MTPDYDDLGLWDGIKYTGTVQGLKMSLRNGGEDGTRDFDWYSGEKLPWPIVNGSATVWPIIAIKLDDKYQPGDFSALIKLTTSYE